MNKQYKLVVKGINNYPDKITVTVALETGGYTSLLLPNVVIDLDRVEGAPLEFYEAEAKKKAKQFFMDIAAGLCEGDEQSQEKCLCSEDRYTIQINNAYNTILSEKDDIESRIEKLECYIAELKKSTPTKNEVLAADEMKETILDRAAHLSCASRLKEHLQRPEEKRRDEQFAAFYDYCIEVTRRNFVKAFEESKSLQ